VSEFSGTYDDVQRRGDWRGEEEEEEILFCITCNL